MFEVLRLEEKPVVAIRNATLQELANYEKWKLEKSTQVNKPETTGAKIPSKKKFFLASKINLQKMSLRSLH